MLLHFKIIGVLLIFLACLHAIFPKFFNWKQDLKSLSLINRQMMIIHTFFIALTVFLMGLLCLNSTSELVETKMGKTISLGFGIFWVIRLVVQFFGYASSLWKGKTFETTIHVLFSILWTYLSVVFMWTALE